MQRKFLDVFTGIPSKIHDSRVLKLSFIEKDLPKLCAPRYHIIGDAAYPLREYLLKPFPDYGNLTNQQKVYNKRFCGTRVLIENTFGILKQRFRQFVRIDFHAVDKMSKLVLSCCVLHNLCIDNDDEWEGNDEDEGENAVENEIWVEPIQNNSTRVLLRLAELKRNEICDSFASE